jgi:MFS transporter, SP family, sugar:H+ symporter
MSERLDDVESGHVIQIAIVAALGGFLFGYDSAVINGAVDAIQSRFQVSAGPLGFAVASALLGAAVGALSAGRIADRYGRLLVMKIAAVTFLVSALFTGLAPDLGILILFRVIGGLGVGMASVIAPAYIAEIAPAAMRGRLASLQQLAIVSGIFLSLLVDTLFAAQAGGANNILWFGLEPWQWMFIAMAVPAVLYGLLSLTIPESPRYLIGRHRVGQARRIMAKLHGSARLEDNIARIQASLTQERPPSWADLKSSAGRIYPIIWVGLALSVFQQFVGINVIFYYSTTLWKAVGFSASNAFIISVISSVINILTTFVAISTIDRVGRKPLLVIGSIGMTLSLATMAVIFVFATKDAAGAPVLTGLEGPVALCAANLFVIAFGMSWGPVVWVLLGELFPNRIRAAALSLAAGAQWVANWVITVSFPALKDISLGLAYGLYAVSALLSLVFVLKFIKETKGKELEDMEA